MKNISHLINKTVDHLKNSLSILFITGAGISADSGLPTYRGIGGIYNNSMTEDGLSIEDALSINLFYEKPEITWKYISQIEQNSRNTGYNQAHSIIAETEKYFQRVWVLTQNVDGFHIDAGSKNVIEIHGNIHKIKCDNCLWHKKIKDFSEITIPLKCPECKSITRPDVVLFGEMLPAKAVETLQNQLETGFDICFTIGTTSVFPYVQQPVYLLKMNKKITVEINPDRTEISEIADIKIPLGAKEAMQKIWKEFKRIIL